MANSNLKCVGCSKSGRVQVALQDEALEMFNFVCCLEISEPDESQGLCDQCHGDLKVSFNFKKRCLEIFANVYEHPNNASDVNENDDGEDFTCLDGLLDQTLHEDDDNSLNLNDLLIPEVCLGNSALSVLDVSDNTKCRYCFNEFNSKEECLSHMDIHKGDDKPYKCPQDGCHSSFKARKNLKDHYLVHSNERPFPCHFCEQTFKSSSNRSKHERRIHSKERNAMRIENSNQQQNKLAEKVKVIIPTPPASKVKRDEAASFTNSDDEERIYRCEQDGCVSSFKTRSSLRDHQKVHSDERPYGCAFCSSSFKSSSNRSKHERGSHPSEYQKRKEKREHQRNGEREEESPPPKKMKVASAPTASPASSQPAPKVIRQETTASPKKQNEFPCRYCDKVLTRADNRDKHEQSHKDIRAFDCGFCSKNFKTQEALREHTKVHSSSSRRSLGPQVIKEEESAAPEFVCEEENCGKVYTTNKSLKNHKKMKHSDVDDTINCDICLKTFPTSGIADHLRQHI